MNKRIQTVEKSLVGLATKIARLEKRISDPDPAPATKRVPVFFTVSFTFSWGDMQVAEQTIKNGAEDAFLHGFTYYVSEEPVGGDPVALVDGAVGMMRALTITAAEPTTRFDFAWDYRIARSQQTYLNAPGAAYPLSRQSLGRRETQKVLYFDKNPLKFEAGGALTFKVQPMCYEPLQTTDVIYLQMVAYGVRTGRMASEVQV